ncbi:MAG: hypothetical protein CMM47_07990 [Rhodospirillaceae bacterium]|mgnify:CR=1 FL=1|nr:hypothetical protein [Rhodospirillaceae bacterium]
MVTPVIPVSTPVNAVLPNLVVPRPVEQLRNTGVRPATAEGVTATDEDNAVEGQNSRRDADTATVLRQTYRNGADGRGSQLDLIV